MRRTSISRAVWRPLTRDMRSLRSAGVSVSAIGDHSSGVAALMAKIAKVRHFCHNACYGGTPMNMNVSLTDELANFVKSKVSAGRYTSSSEVVREALRLMEKVEQQEAEKLNFLRQAWKEGLDSGDAGEVDFAALKKEARARLAASKA